MIFRHKSHRPDPRPLTWAVVVLLFASALATHVAPVVGLTVLGATLILSGIYVEMVSESVWNDYLKLYKKNKKKFAWYNRPTNFFYVFNTYILFPFIMLFGLACLVLAYKLI